MFKQGDVVVWDPGERFITSLRKSHTEAEMIKFYGVLGYGAEKKPLFVFMAPINGYDDLLRETRDTGHCVLLNLDNGVIERMVHTHELRLATEEEF